MEKIIDLIKKTNDKCIILDSTGEVAFVAMSFSEYEKLISGGSNIANLTEEQLLERINKDVAVWRGSQQEQDLNDWQSLETAVKKSSEQKSEPEIDRNSLNQAEKQFEGKDSEDKYYFEPIE